ncbi:MAG: toxin-antitoxin system protein [Chloroflexota bacterium]
MKTTTVRIQDQTQAKLKELADQTRESMVEVLAKAVEVYRRQMMIEQTNAAYAALRRDSAGWQEELREPAAWDGTMLDGPAAV